MTTEGELETASPQTRIGSRVVSRTENLEEFIPQWIQQGTREIERHVPIVTYTAVPTYFNRRVPRVIYDLEEVTTTVRVPRVTYKEVVREDTVSIPRVRFETVNARVEEQVPKVSFTTVEQEHSEFIPTVHNDFVNVRDYKYEPDLTYIPVETPATRDRIVYNPVEKSLPITRQLVWPEVV